MEQEITKPCTCQTCVRACEKYPGWMTPEEAEKAIDAGYAPKLMIDWLSDFEDGNVEVLAPASEGSEGGRAPEMPYEGSIFAILYAHDWCPGRCVLLKDGLCTIHDSGFKPIHCRRASCDPKQSAVSKHEVADLWRGEKGTAVMQKWKEALEARE